MNDTTRPKLYPPRALLAFSPQSLLRFARPELRTEPGTQNLRRLVAAMID